MSSYLGGTGSIQNAYLPTTRQFPANTELLVDELNKSYIDTAQAINYRTIGIFDKFQSVTGERWFNDTNPQQKRQTYRQVYTFGAIAAGATLTFAHNISGTITFTRIYGTCQTDFATVDPPDSRPIPYASATDTLKNISIKCDAKDVTINNGANAPNITSGIVVLEYLLN